MSWENSTQWMAIVVLNYWNNSSKTQAVCCFCYFIQPVSSSNVKIMFHAEHPPQERTRHYEATHIRSCLLELSTTAQAPKYYNDSAKVALIVCLFSVVVHSRCFYSFQFQFRPSVKLRVNCQASIGGWRDRCFYYYWLCRHVPCHGSGRPPTSWQ